MKSFILYFILEIIAILFIKKYEKNDSKQKRFIFLSALILVVLVGFRAVSVGADTLGYTNAFYRLIDGDLSSADKNWLSTGYRIIAYIVGFIFGKNYVALNTTIAIITLTFLYKSIDQNSKDKSMSLYILFSTCLFYQMLNQSRQMLAISIVLYSYKFIKTRNLKSFLITIGGATLIHSSAIIFVPFYYLLNMEMNRKTIYKYIAICLLIVLCWDLFYEAILMTNYGKIYIATNYYETSKTSIINFIFRLCLLLFVFLFRKSSEKDKENKFLYNLGIWCTILSFITIKLYIFGRITTYFYVFYIFIIPNILSTLNKKQKFYKGFVYVLFLVLHIVYFYLMCDSGGYGNYSMFFVK